MNDWVILAALVLVAAIITVAAFRFLKAEEEKDPYDDDHDDILGI